MARSRNSVIGTLPQYALESSITNNFGMGFEHGPQLNRILLQIVKVVIEHQVTCGVKEQLS